MRQLEIITAILIVLGIGMKLLLIPGGSVLLGISLSILACIYHLAGIFFFNRIPMSKIFKKESYEGLSVLRLVGAYGGGVIFSILSVGILFKLSQLPGSGVMLMVGLVAGSLFLLGVVIKYFISLKSSFYRSMTIRSILIVGISGILYVTPGLTLVKIFYRDHPEYIQAYEQASDNPNDKELQQRAEEVREKVND